MTESASQPGAEKHSVTLPEGWDYLTHFISPNGTGIAWVLTAEPMPKYSQFVSKLLPWLKGDTPPRTGLWVSDWQGRGMREIGHIYEKPPAPISVIEHSTPIIDKVEWLPDESGISFVHDDAFVSCSAVKCGPENGPQGL